ncbi:MAG: hypothetical protein OHK0022_11920 [Roseiflexaceae bacterium]
MAAESRSDVGQHLVALADRSWSLWRWAALRGSGFPSQRIAELASLACAAEADRAGAAQAEQEQRRQELVGLLHARLDHLREAGQWEDAARRRALLDAIRQVNKGKLPRPGLPADAELGAAVEALARAQAEAAAAQARAVQTLQDERPLLLERLRAMAQDPRFCEAMLWQNREAYQTLRALRSADVASPLGRRESELALKYLQRYYTKNDSIGFFGPIGWATLAPDGPPLVISPGADLLASRTVGFEQWAVDRLAAHWSGQTDMRPWIAPQRLPSVWLDGATLRLAGQTLDLPAGQAALLRAVLDLCDGLRPAGELAAMLLAARSTPLSDEQAVYQLLETMETSGLIRWAFALPVLPDSFAMLVQALQQISDPALAGPALRAVAQLEQDRRAVAAAAGDPARLEAALDQLAARFTAITGQSTSQAHGRTYAARTLVYEDCRRGLDVTVGPQIWGALGAPLSLLLTSARWITFQVGQRCRAVFTALYRQMAAELGTPEVPMVAFWQRAQPYLSGARPDLVAPVLEAFQQHWDSILCLPTGQREVRRQSAELRSAVAERFAAPGPGWSTARHHSPDVLLAAASPEALCESHYTAVLGELHVGVNTLRASLFVRQHPAPQELLEAVVSDIPEPCVVPVEPKHWPGVTARTSNLFVTPKDFRLQASDDAIAPAGDPQALPIGMLLISEADGALMIHTDDRRLRFDCVEFVAGLLGQLVVNLFQILPDRPHTPRISIDRLVIARETWCFDGTDLAPLWALDEAEQFIELRRWATRHGFPRCVFVRISSERKPFFVDFASPPLAALLIRVVRQACAHDQRVWVSITEMLPALDALWLTDAEGRRYTSELRLIAVDQSGQDSDEDWGYL